MTTEPVRALTTTFAGGCAGTTSSDSSSATKATRWAGSPGSRTRTTRPSSGCAVVSPSAAGSALLIASATCRASEKSVRTISSRIVSASSAWLGTLRSTVAPPGIRPALR